MATFRFQNKYVCGAYYNMAQNNFRLAILHVLSRIGINRKDEERAIPELLDTIYGFLTGDTEHFNDTQILQKKVLTLRYDQQVKLRELLFRQFPILKPIIASETHKSLQEQKEKLSEMEEYIHEFEKQLKRLYRSKKGKASQEQKEINEQIKQLKTKKSKYLDEYDTLLFSKSHDADLQLCLKILKTMAWCLYDLRDFYTHYDPYNTPESLKVKYLRQVTVANWLSQVFAASRTIDKERNSITTEEMNFLNEAKKQGDDKKWREDPDYYFAIKGQNLLSSSFIDADSPIYNDYLDELYQKYRKKRLAWMKEQRDEALERDDEEEYGFWVVEMEKLDNPERIAKIKSKICPLALSDFGVLYFCATFLPRNYTLLMADHAELMKYSPYSMTAEELEARRNACKTDEEREKIDQTDTPRNNILREMLCIYRVRLPKGKRLDKKDTKGLLTLDILNELRKCPKEVYEQLSKEGKDFFISRVSSASHNAPDIVKRIRFGDRFPYLALRAIDESDVFKRIRFQVRLGSYRFYFYNKTCIDGSTQLRRWQKEINGFGRLQDMEALRKSLWKDLLQKKEYDSVQLEDKSSYLDLQQFKADAPDSVPYITDSQAQYNIHNNRIGLIWNGDECRLLRNIKDADVLREYVYFPDLKDNDGNPKKSGKDIEQPSPLCSLSTYELPALLFYHFLYNTPEAQVHKERLEKPEQVIIKKYEALRAFFLELRSHPEQIVKTDLQATLTRFGLKCSEIPQRIIDCIQGYQQKQKETESSVTYLPDLLQLPMEDIRQKVQEKGMERYKDLPAKFRKQISHEQIVTSGLETLLKPLGISVESLPAKVMEALLSTQIQEDVAPAEDTSTEKPFNIMFVRSVVYKLHERLQDVSKRYQSFVESIHHVGSKDNKFAKHGYMDVRHGKLAEYLAGSFLKWQPTISNGSDKLTGLNYNVLKSFLSTYGIATDIDDLTAVLHKAKLIHLCKEETPIPHPFLQKVIDKEPGNLEKLFHLYIIQEKEYLSDLLIDYLLQISTAIGTEGQDADMLEEAYTCNGEKLISDMLEEYEAKSTADSRQSVYQLEHPAFTHPKRERWKQGTNIATLTQLAKSYTNPLLLPDGLFTEAIRHLMEIVYSDNQKLQDELSRQNSKGEAASHSVAFIIDVYSRIVLNDHAQSYYCSDLVQPECTNFARSYRLFDKLNNQKDPFKAFIRVPMDTIGIMQQLKTGKEQFEAEVETYIIDTERREKAEAEQKVRNKSVRENWKLDRYEQERERAIDNASWPDSKKQEERDKMERMKRFVQKNERAIRRYRIQDITLFLMARNMLSEVFSGDDGQSFDEQSRQNLKLENVCNEDFLSQTIDYEYAYQLGDRTVTIHQAGMSLKNYGQFYRFLGDVRLDTLLMLLANVKSVTLTDVASEFAKYDQERPLAFKKLQLLEQLAIETDQTGTLYNPEADGFSFINPKGQKEPKRNNFAKLLDLLKDLGSDKNKLLTDIRNALGHNKYITDSSAMTLNEQLEITQVAVKMSEQISLLQQGIQENIK